MDNVSYIIADTVSNHAVMIDPTWEVDGLISACDHQQLTCKAIWLTHTHYDHIQGLDACIQRWPDLPVFVHANEQQTCAHLNNVQVIQDGDTLSLGNGKWTVWHTPGHSPGGVCFYTDGHLISGDTLFVDRCGRADIQGADVKLLYQSLQRLKLLPPNTIIYPGHDYGHQPTDTLGQQLGRNPYLKADSEAEFIRLRMGQG